MLVFALVKEEIGKGFAVIGIGTGIAANGIGPVSSPEFGNDVIDVEVNGRLGYTKFCRYLRGIKVEVEKQVKHFNFTGCKRLYLIFERVDVHRRCFALLVTLVLVNFLFVFVLCGCHNLNLAVYSSL